MVNGLPSLLERVGAKQIELADAIGVTQETVSRWVNGHTTKVTGQNLLGILFFLQKKDASITLDDLAGRKRKGVAA